MKWISFIFAASTIFAKDLGQKGLVFPVVEPSLIESMQCKAALHESELKKYAEEIESYIQNPPAIAGIGKATSPRVFYYDPTYTFEEDLEAEGILIAKKGEKINPLEEFDLPGGILFFDGSDPAQVAWARTEPADFKWVLVKGSPIALEEEEGRPVYYDQMGYFTTRFKIQNVPAIVMQEGKLLRIEEVALP